MSNWNGERPTLLLLLLMMVTRTRKTLRSSGKYLMCQQVRSEEAEVVFTFTFRFSPRHRPLVGHFYMQSQRRALLCSTLLYSYQFFLDLFLVYCHHRLSLSAWQLISFFAVGFFIVSLTHVTLDLLSNLERKCTVYGWEAEERERERQWTPVRWSAVLTVAII